MLLTWHPRLQSALRSDAAGDAGMARRHAPAELIPRELWGAVGTHLRERDLATLACVSTSMRAAAREAFATRKALRVSHARVGQAVAACPEAQGLVVRGFPRRYSTVAAGLGTLAPPPAMPRLRTLELHHPRMPSAPGFWPLVFERCPLLRRAKFVGDFFMGNYGADVEHVMELITHGAPRLHDLDIEGGWMVLFRVNEATLDLDPRLGRVLKALATMPPVPSTTLRRLRHACQQVPLGVDGPVEDLFVDEQYDGPLLVAQRLGPRTLTSVTRLRWKARWPSCDARALGAMTRLRDADISLLGTSTPSRLTYCLDSLVGLPASIRRLKLDLDVWLMRAGDSDVQWPDVLGHLDRLERLELTMLFPPTSIETLLGHWLGAGPAVRSVLLKCTQPATCALEDEIARLVVEESVPSDDETLMELNARWAHASRPVSGAPLAAWLAARPGATATIRGVPNLSCSHPRCMLSPF